MNPFALRFVSKAFASVKNALSTPLYSRNLLDLGTGVARKDVTETRLESALTSWRFGSPSGIADIFDNLESDPYIKGVMRQWIAGILGISAEVKAAGDDPDQKDVADEVRAVWDDATVNRWQMMSALLKAGPARGGGFVETIWSEPTEAGPRRWTRFQAVPQQRVRFVRETGEMAIAPDAFTLDGVPLSTFGVGKFLHAIVDEDVPDFSKRGIERALINEWMTRRESKGNWDQYVERFGAPQTHVKTDNGADRESLKAWAREHGSFANTVTSKETEMTLLEASRSGTVSPYEARLRNTQQEIAMAFLGETQTAMVGTEEGSQASAKVHADVADSVLLAMWSFLSFVITRDLFGAYVAINRGAENVSRLTPRLIPRLSAALDLKTVAEAVKTLRDAGVPLSLSWVYETAGIARPASGDEMLEAEPLAVRVAEVFANAKPQIGGAAPAQQEQQKAEGPGAVMASVLKDAEPKTGHVLPGRFR